MKFITDTSPIPGLQDIYQANTNRLPQFKNLSDILSGLLNIAFYAAVFAAFYFLVWGALAYIMAQGQKEDLAKARARITWALVGLMVILLAYFIARFVAEILGPNITGGIKGGVPF